MSKVCRYFHLGSPDPAAAAGLSLPVAVPQTLSKRTSDGVRLDVDVSRPDAAGEFPVLLMRQPYGRRIASTVSYAQPSWYAANGYSAAIVCTSSRYASSASRLMIKSVCGG